MNIEFLVTALIVVLLPGTGVIYTLSCGLAYGLRTSFAAAFGCTLGIIPHLTASIFGLAALLHTSALAFQIVKYAGVVYLLYMAWRTWDASNTLAISEKVEKLPLWKVATTGFLINILNPKLSIFFLAFLPQFVAPEALHPMLEMTSLALIFMGLTLFVFIAYGAFAAAARTYVTSRPLVVAWMHRTFAVAFASLGLKLAMAER